MSNNYNPETKIYYGGKDADHRLVPAPNITVSLEFNYSNDSIVGYTYVINLTGYATALDLRDIDNQEIPANPNYNTGAVVDHINKLREILTQNGSILYVVNSQDEDLLKAKGGILRSFSVDESPNNWIHYASYSASLEFSSVDFGAKTEACDSSFLDASTYNVNGIIDISKYKIKSFNDSWSLNFDENESFSKIKNNDVNSNIDIDNHNFNIEYTISAVGKHFFVYEENSDDSKLLPAWEQAKNFVQYRLYKQVKGLINNILKDTYSDGCTSSDGLNSILTPGSGTGLLKELNANYKIYNEQITCEASESEGSFSATYSAIVKSSLGDSRWSTPETKHSITKSIVNNRSNGNLITNISVNGTIEGLIEGGLIRTNVPIELPESGSMFIYNSDTTNRYDNAKILLDKIYSDSDYNNGLGANSKRDFKKQFKDILGITTASLGITVPSSDTVPDAPHPISFNLTHDYNAGTINYSAEYSSRSCGRKFYDISIQTSNPTKIIAVFNVPNSKTCPIIQELGTQTAKTVSITVQGVDLSDTGQPPTVDATAEVLNALNLGCDSEGDLPITLPTGIYIITQQQYVTNPIDGSFTLNMSYICDTSGCLI